MVILITAKGLFNVSFLSSDALDLLHLSRGVG
jgi:hypothetical protein